MSQYTAKQILAFTRYADLFTDDHKKELKTLQHHWHPDRNKDPQANEVFVHIMSLYNMTNVPLKTSEVDYVNLKGEHCTFKYFCSEVLPFGKAYYINGAVCYVFNEDSKFLITHFQNNLYTMYKHIHTDFKDKYSFALPVIHLIQSPDNVLILKIPKDFVPLSLVYKYYGQNLNPRLAAWITSRLFDYSMLLHVGGFVGNGFSMPTVLVDLKGHRLFDMTSYFFATKIDGKLHALNADTIDFYPHDCLTSKRAQPKCDVALIKRLAIQLFGDSTGTGVKLNLDLNIPGPIVRFLMAISTNQKYEAYKEWQHTVLVDSFGKRSFFKTEVETALLLNQ